MYLCVPCTNFTPPPWASPLAATSQFSVPVSQLPFCLVYFFKILQVGESRWCLSLSDSFHLAQYYPEFTHVVTNGKTSLYDWVIFHCPYTTSSIHLLMDSGCFRVLVIVNNAAMIIKVWISSQIDVVFFSLWVNIQK